VFHRFIAVNTKLIKKIYRYIDKNDSDLLILEDILSPRRRVALEGSFTARPTRRAWRKVGLSDPTMPSGRAITQRIKVTGGIIG